jgi:LDH2 family malate/lactate/ureidoglycolate dehydrogenase
VPGEPERRRRSEFLDRGIDVDERTWAEILGAARMLGLGDAQIQALVT